MDDKEFVRMSITDAEKLGIRWAEICEVTGQNGWAVNEGLSKDTVVEVPIVLIRK